MTQLQNDILEIYNNLQEFSKETLEGPEKIPIHVRYEQDINSLSFEQRGKKVYLPALNYYCGRLKEISDSWLLPEDYDYLMKTLSTLIGRNVFINPRVCISPEYYGFDVYETQTSSMTFRDGPQLLGTIRVVSGNSWLFRILTKIKYRKHLL